MSKILYYYPKDNTLYIATKVLMPNTSNLSFKEHRRICKEVFAMSYEDRIEKYCTDDQKLEIKTALNEHPGCKISEFC